MEGRDWDRISGDYYSEIISPLKNSVSNPLLDDLKEVSGDFSVLELGCGVGELIPFFSSNFREVVAIDFSPDMIELAKKKEFPNVLCMVKDMTDLKEFREKFDVAVSVNSILAPDVVKIDKIIKEIFNCLKPGGRLFVIIPAIESYIYQSMLITESKIKEGIDVKDAVKEASDSFDGKKSDLLQGILCFDKDSQKAFYRFEITYRFEKAGFRNVVIERVLYPWKEWRDAGQEYFPRKMKPWDWYFTCEKPK